MPEIVREGIYKETLKNKIFPRLKKTLQKYDNLEWFDVEKLIPDSDEFFLDKMHFTRKGNIFFSNLISKKIINLEINDTK